MAHMKKHQKGAMHSSQESQKRTHDMSHRSAGGKTPAEHLGESEHEAAPWGHGQHSNLPQDVRMDHFRKPPHHGDRVQNDTITGIDDIDNREEGKTNKYWSNQK